MDGLPGLVAAPAPPAPAPAPAAGSGPAGAAPVRVRSKFPESWIWTSATASGNGEVVHRATVPDTITSWIASAFAVSDQTGLGVAPDTAKLEVFRPFFIRLNLPYSVKRGEKLALQVLIFNYMTASQDVSVKLEHDETSGFDFVEKSGGVRKPSKDKPAANYNIRRVTVPGGGGSRSVFFPIVPTKIGDVKLKLIARSQTAGDAIEQPLLVEPEGLRVDMNRPVVVDLAGGTSSFRQSVQMDFPPDYVEGSRGAEVAVIGDVMGPVLNNVEKLVKMPYGCGEQNMVTMVPNIVVMRYLTATQRLTPQLETKAKKYMTSGYQRELTYKRADNSFSAFGKSDKHGSTWLTAFVVRSFKQAQEYIFVDDKILSDAIKFLNTQQKENGAFEERGEVHHKAMQGGASEGGVGLTAYVLIAMLENGVRDREALNYLEQSLSGLRDQTYELAVVTYALHLADSPKKETAFNMLEEKAVQANGLKHWSDTVGEKPKEDRYWYSGPRPVDVEMTSYALLTYMLRQDTNGGLPIVRWLTTQRNAYGGYSSTQDTVMALLALGAYAEKVYSPTFNVQITAKNGDEKMSFKVEPRNSIVFQQKELNNLDEAVELTATGNGVVFAQVSWHYHMSKLRDDLPFTCNPDILQKSDNDLTVNMCCKYNPSGKQSNMAVMEFPALSGFTLDNDKLNGLTTVADIQRVESVKGDTFANIYFNKLGNSYVCFNVTSEKSFQVSEQKPAVVKMYDYYNPEESTETEYTARRKRSLQSECASCWSDIPAVGEEGPLTGGGGGGAAGGSGAGTGTCKDRWSGHCRRWRRNGYCRRARETPGGKLAVFMRGYCKASCGFCS